MRARLPRRTGFALALTLAACGSSRGPLDAGPDDATGAVDGPAPDDGAGGRGEDAAPDARLIDGGAVDAPMESRPVFATVNRRLVSGAATLVGDGLTSCTNQPGATGDRWCAFVAPSKTSLGFNELWVINASRAATGAAILCDGTDPACLRLSAGLYVDPDRGALDHGFTGDTLIYYEEPSTDPTGFIGVVKAWRPGFAAGRKLTSTSGIICVPHDVKAAVICFENLVTSAGGETTTADLLAGSLDDGAGGGVLPKVDTLLISALGDAAGVQAWQAGFSPDGTRVAWSTRSPPTGLETLKLQTLGDVTSRQMVATDVSRWEIARDGTHWLWLNDYAYIANVPSGTLTTAAFPGGGAPTPLALDVARFEGVGAGGVLFQTGASGQLRLMPDRTQPTTTQLLDQGIVGWVAHSADGTTVVYAKNVFSDGTNDLFVRRAAAPAPCTLAAANAYPFATLLATNGLVMWNQVEPLSTFVPGRVTSVATCATTTFGADVLRWLPVGDDSLAFLDTPLSVDLLQGTLRASTVQNGTLPAQGTSLHANVSAVFASLAPAVPGVVYTVKTDGPFDGLYVYVGPPFAAAP